jgi:hypothetical protein
LLLADLPAATARKLPLYSSLLGEFGMHLACMAATKVSACSTIACASLNSTESLW